MKTRIALTSLALASALLAGCPKDDRSVPDPKACATCGTVEQIVSREVKGDATPAGTVAGAVIGGVIGHQFGGNSRSRDAATAVGAVGGAFAGREVEKEVKKHMVYDITIRMADGTVRTLTRPSDQNLREGDRVEVHGTTITRA